MDSLVHTNSAEEPWTSGSQQCLPGRVRRQGLSLIPMGKIWSPWSVLGTESQGLVYTLENSVPRAMIIWRLVTVETAFKSKFLGVHGKWK